MTRPQTSIERFGIQQPENILKAAERVFGQKGSSATMEDIASEAGISQGLAYRYFSSKEEIFSILFRRTMESAKEYDQIIKELPGTSSERFERIVSRILEMRKEKPGYYQVLYQMLSDKETPKEIREAVSRRGVTFRSEMRKLLIEGQKAGKIANDDPDQLFEAVMGAIDGLWRRIAYDPKSVKNFPDPKIILRMLKPDRKARKSN